MSRDDLRSIVLEICQDLDTRTSLLVELDEICGQEPLDAAWLAVALAERSPGHADQVVDVVVRMSNEVERLRTDKRVGQRIASLASEHGPGGSRIGEIRAYCLSLSEPADLERLAALFEDAQLNRPPLPVSRTAQGLAAYAVGLARGGGGGLEDVNYVIDRHQHADQYQRMESAFLTLTDYEPPAGWDDRLFERRTIGARIRGFFRRLFGRR